MVKTGTYLQCINCGFQTDLLRERKFRCPNCNDLFDVVHRIPSLSTSEWIELFNERRVSHRLNSGVWRFKEWIMPCLSDEDIVTLGEGIVPIVQAGPNLKEWINKDIDLWLILEGKSPTGSFKDFGMTVLISVAKAAGIKAVVCASTGDTSASLAAYAAVAGITCVVLLPEGKITPEQILQVELFGAKVILLPGPFDDCMEVLQRLVLDYEAYPGNSLNPARIEGHQATVFLLAQFFDWRLPDWLVAPIGNGSNCSSLGKALRLMKNQGFEAKTKILGCQSEAADPLSLSWFKSGGMKTTQEEWELAFKPVSVGETIATAARIGNPVSYKKVIREIVASEGVTSKVREEELKEAVSVCARDGQFVCPQTGIAMAGLRRATRGGLINAGERVVIVSTGDGLKFTKPFESTPSLRSKVTVASDCRVETIAKILDLS